MYSKLPLVIALCLLPICNAFSQQEKGIYGVENWLNIWTEFNSGDQEYNIPTQILTGNITKDTKLYKKETYLLLGNVFVTDSTSLTIEPGTVILGDYKSQGSLIISNGSKIIAEGTQTDPIIFSSNRSVKKRGDWGGIFILGNAPINKIGSEWQLEYGLKPSSPQIISYGGNDTESYSGILKYVRIEYAGKRTKDFGYFNGLTLAGVGSETIIDNIMVTYCEGSSFYVLGGNTNLSQLISFRSRQHDFIFNYGAQALIKNSLAIKSPYFTKSGGASSIYLASYDTKEEVDPDKRETHLAAENLTLLTLSDDLQADISVGLVSEALYVKKGASFSIKKSIISGFNPAVILDNKIFINDENLNNMEFSNMYFNNCKGNIFTEGMSNNEDLENWYGNSIFKNVYSRGSDTETFIDAKNLDNPDFRLRINKIIATNLPDEN
jgi:hypothetical protein